MIVAMAGMKGVPAAAIIPRTIDIPYRVSRYGTDLSVFATMTILMFGHIRLK